MDIYDRKGLKIFLQTQGIWLEKEKGQHYLVMKRVVEGILDLAEVGENDLVVETGAGVGSLTLGLAEKVGEVWAVELDGRVVSALRVMVGLKRNVLVKEEDAMKMDLPLGRDWKWVANIPYQITAPLMRKMWVETENSPESAVVMVQKEVGEKMLSKKGKENRLSLLVKNFAEVGWGFGVGRESFFPEPKVDSVVMWFKKRSEPVIKKERWGEVEKLMGVGFRQKRKKLRNSLLSLPGWGEEIFEVAGVECEKRPEDLTLGEWEALSEAGKGF